MLYQQLFLFLDFTLFSDSLNTIAIGPMSEAKEFAKSMGRKPMPSSQ